VHYSDQVFEDRELTLDGNTFENCTFRNVVFTYSGGDLVMTRCVLESFSFRFGGALATGLFALYQLFGTDDMLQIIRGFTEPTPGKVELSPHKGIPASRPR
jgi:hypothetical protein